MCIWYMFVFVTLEFAEGLQSIAKWFDTLMMVNNDIPRLMIGSLKLGIIRGQDLFISTFHVLVSCEFKSCTYRHIRTSMVCFMPLEIDLLRCLGPLLIK